MRKGLKSGAYSLVMIALFTALIIVGAFVKIPMQPVPFTLQFLFTSLAGVFLGAKRGCAAVAVYVLLGLVGVPVFTKGGGFWYVLEPTFGYLLGFIVGTFLEGLIVERAARPTALRLLMAGTANLAVSYAAGLIYCYCITNFALGTPLGFWPVFLTGFLLTAPHDIAIIILVAFALKKVVPTVRRGFAARAAEKAPVSTDSGGNR